MLELPISAVARTPALLGRVSALRHGKLSPRPRVEALRPPAYSSGRQPEQGCPIRRKTDTVGVPNYKGFLLQASSPSRSAGLTTRAKQFWFRASESREARRTELTAQA
jgi:hypothetical protein